MVLSSLPKLIYLVSMTVRACVYMNVYRMWQRCTETKLQFLRNVLLFYYRIVYGYSFSLLHMLLKLFRSLL